MLKLRIGDLRKALRVNINKLLATILGEDVLSKEEREELESLDKLPKKSLRLVDKAFILGRLKAILTSKETSTISYEELIEHANNIELDTVEKLAVQHAKLNAAAHIKNLADAIATDTMTAVQGAASSALNEATVKQVVRDETALAIIQKKSYQELASTLADKLKQVHGKDWELISQTELHAAKTQGIAQAILNGVDVYQGRGGPDARVSVIPKPTACEDCKTQYLDGSGNPKIFLLSELIAAGSNADSVHSKRNGIHIYWKPTLPPLHPRCRCDLQYIPDGASWKEGKLVMPADLAKAIGDSSLSATIKPKGPKSVQKPANNPSIKGAASPAQGITATPKSFAPKSTSTATAATMHQDAGSAKTMTGTAGPGGAQEYVACPFGGGDECKTAGGSGAPQHSRDGKSMKAHQEYLAAQGKSLDDPAESAEKELKAKEFNKTPHSNQVKLDHMQNGVVESIKPLGKGATNTTFKVRIAGNGHGLMKTADPFSVTSEKNYTSGVGDGNGATARGEWHKKEAAAYHVYSAFGLHDHVPPTAIRTHPTTGEAVSMQTWADNYESAGTHANEKYKADTGEEHAPNDFEAIMRFVPDSHKEKIKTKLTEGAVMGIVMNNCDMHLDNVMISKDFTDVKFIDHSFSFGTSLLAQKNQILRDMHRAGHKVKVPDHLMDRFSKTTLSDLQRASGEHLSDWEVGQTFLRMKYVEHLQKTEGHLDFHKFRGVVCSADGSQMEARKTMWSANSNSTHAEELMDYWDTKAKGLCPHQMFDSFAKQWIDDAKSLPEGHQDRIAAEELDKIGVFMGVGFAVDPVGYRQEGKHRRYESRIKPGYPPKHVPTAEGIITKEQIKAGQEKTVQPAEAQDNAVKQEKIADADEKVKPSFLKKREARKQSDDAPGFSLGAPSEPKDPDETKTKKALRLFIRLD